MKQRKEQKKFHFHLPAPVLTMMSVPPRGSGWVRSLPIGSSCDLLIGNRVLQILKTHPLPRGGTDLHQHLRYRFLDTFSHWAINSRSFKILAFLNKICAGSDWLQMSIPAARKD